MALPTIPRTVTWFPRTNGGIECDPAFVVIERWNEAGCDNEREPVIEVLYYEGEKECTSITS